jgi:hypothetical protein
MIAALTGALQIAMMNTILTSVRFADTSGNSPAQHMTKMMVLPAEGAGS